MPPTAHSRHTRRRFPPPPPTHPPTHPRPPAAAAGTPTPPPTWTACCRRSAPRGRRPSTPVCACMHVVLAGRQEARQPFSLVNLAILCIMKSLLLTADPPALRCAALRCAVLCCAAPCCAAREKARLEPLLRHALDSGEAEKAAECALPPACPARPALRCCQQPAFRRAASSPPGVASRALLPQAAGPAGGAGRGAGCQQGGAQGPGQHGGPEQAQRRHELQGECGPLSCS